uniref:FBA_2 domain-containing protein n=2 Tax=Caenorhabditis tropicalis TaxID=1561998 RepID=A0A1I7TCA0_9PELO
MSIETKDSEYCMNLYFEDQIEGLKTVTEYFCSLFGLDIYSINISRYTILNGPSDVIEWIIQRQKRLSAFWVEHLDASDTVASLLLDKCRIGSSAYINMKVPHQFEFNFKFEGDGYLEIQRGSWFTLENMLNVNCEKLSLRGTSLTNRDINLFLKHWMSTDLKFTQIKIYPEKPMSENVIFTGIPTVRKNTKVYKETEVFAIYKGFQVKRNDGLKTARIMVNHVDPYNRHGLFWMVIWDTV